MSNIGYYRIMGLIIFSQFSINQFRNLGDRGIVTFEEIVFWTEQNVGTIQQSVIQLFMFDLLLGCTDAMGPCNGQFEHNCSYGVSRSGRAV